MKFFNFDQLSLTMIFVTIFIDIITFIFSLRYLYGDRKYKSFILKIAILVPVLIMKFSVDHIILFAGFWFLSNIIIVSLIIHKSEWRQSYNSGILYLKYLCFAFLSLMAAIAFFYYITDSFSISTIISYKFTINTEFTIAITLLSLFVIIQSSVVPFHKWIVSSLNAPTPVSAIMHGGIVNGGGFILIRFSKVYLQHENIMDIIFVLSSISIIISTLWKLMQNDIKRMLACSTISQMSYMLCQCSIGAFFPALLHIIMHSIFKANLFLNAPSAANENIVKNHSLELSKVFISITVAFIISSFFLLGYTNFLLHFNADLVFISIVFIFCCEFTITILKKHTLCSAILVSFAIGCPLAIAYGKILSTIDSLFGYDSTEVLKLKFIHIIFIICLLLTWLLNTIKPKVLGKSRFVSFLYINLLNFSQPHEKTITKNRNSYRF